VARIYTPNTSSGETLSRDPSGDKPAAYEFIFVRSCQQHLSVYTFILLFFP